MSEVVYFIGDPKRELQIACMDGRLGRVQEILSLFPTLKTEQLGNVCGMCWACAEGQLEVAKYFVSLKVSVSHTCDGWPTLYRAANFNRRNVVEYLIQEGANVNASIINGHSSALFLSCLSCAHDVTDILLRNGANAELKGNDKGDTPLMAACYNANGCSLECVDKLINAGCDINAQNYEGFTALHSVCRKNRYKRNSPASGFAERLISKGANVNARSTNETTPLHLACENGVGDRSSFQIQLGMSMLNRGRDLASRPFPYAAEINKLNEIWFHGNSPDEPQLVDFLIQHGAEINATMIDGTTPIYYAARCGSVQIVQLLLSHGANPDIHLKNGERPISVASKFGHFNVVKFLLEKGIPYSNDLFQYSALSGNANLVELLLKCGGRASINETFQQTGVSALFSAVYYGHLDVVKLLLQNNADPNTHKADGFTALMQASKDGDLEMCKILISYGANLAQRAIDGNTALSLSGNVSVKMFLKLKGFFSGGNVQGGRSATYTVGVIKSGWCYKSGVINPLLKRRWFILTGEAIYYYKEPTSQRPQGQIFLTDIKEFGKGKLGGYKSDFGASEDEKFFRIYTVSDRVIHVLPMDDTHHNWIIAITEAKKVLEPQNTDLLQQQLNEFVPQQQVDASSAPPPPPLPAN